MKTMTRQQVATRYGISVRTLANWCKREGIHLPPRRLLTCRQLDEIQAAFGLLPR